ncbi:MAG: hypothetical protein GQ540_08395 [Lutibacter sp.]|uniref:NRDE family protein n=1 Tax=Lutibacter sp. TaxID=1925666 RepID=UPI001A089C2A|nr:NRDE family protein [Lutibacter sp.]NOR28533.1 hypothetical protein [Lutibacter sp.]
MCTVTFLPLAHNNFILTSNRDEQRLRETLPPAIYKENNIKMLFPKDKIAGGTWIGTSSKNRLICILNGAFIKHVKKDTYKKSRGVIGKEILQTSNFKNYIEKSDLEDVEPFTMVIIDWNDKQLNLHELIWDSEKKYFNKLKNEPKIWSSSTLYTDEIKQVRKQWFKDWVTTTKNKFNQKEILNFHHSEIGDKSQSILMKRSYVETVSITSVKKENGTIEMLYEDVVHEEKIVSEF